MREENAVSYNSQISSWCCPKTYREPAVIKEDRGQPGQVTQCLGMDLFVGSLSTHSFRL